MRSLPFELTLFGLPIRHFLFFLCLHLQQCSSFWRKLACKNAQMSKFLLRCYHLPGAQFIFRSCAKDEWRVTSARENKENVKRKKKKRVKNHVPVTSSWQQCRRKEERERERRPQHTKYEVCEPLALRWNRLTQKNKYDSLIFLFYSVLTVSIYEMLIWMLDTRTHLNT